MVWPRTCDNPRRQLGASLCAVALCLGGPCGSDVRPRARGGGSERRGEPEVAEHGLRIAARATHACGRQPQRDSLIARADNYARTHAEAGRGMRMMRHGWSGRRATRRAVGGWLERRREVVVGLQRIRSRTTFCAVGIHRGTQQRIAAPLAVHGVLPRRERDVPAAALRSQMAKPMSRIPSSGPLAKCSSASASFPGGLPASFGGDLHGQVSV